MAPMPLSGAGLVRFFEGETRGVKIKPEAVIIGALALIASILLAHVLLGVP
ncbi:MAG: preprotein translocase subunit Sec61beta [Candidatus Nezhaarchaeota archaeon]|nr:preprotein translocase subunit Sec61beta [Candidatus Nezhaarchaeota archaeon]